MSDPKDPTRVPSWAALMGNVSVDLGTMAPPFESFLTIIWK